jgi:hypothetical protein
MEGRSIVDSELEPMLGPPPFETFALYRGQRFGRTRFGMKLKSNYRKVGVLKGKVNILLPGQETLVSDAFLAKLMVPRSVTVRVNVLKGFGFLPMDEGTSLLCSVCLSEGFVCSHAYPLRQP